ncbi:MAG TPA: exo-beta-N-acetylmuramidase NamZ domain-containing protein [Vicinamibacterales bacterium]|nr:exo-beta-N-acetylmuramidase NamZ domain-containing protein [Vicinamibacterales bacterium]
MPVRMRAGRWAAMAALAIAAGVSLPAQTKPVAGFDRARLSRIDAAVADAIAQHQLPGAVVVIGRGDSVVWRKAYGQRAIVPSPEPMTLDTVFDIASLTKVVATTPAVMMLVEEGRIRLTDPVAAFIAEFAKYGKERVTIRDLLTHMSGLRPDLDLGEPWEGRDEAIRRACEEVLTDPPGRRFVYSDINFFLLGEIVSRVSGQPLDVFAQDRIFKPLGMLDTAFRPNASSLPGIPMIARLAPTEPCASAPCPQGAGMLRGLVHDPTARRMGGVAGHAGVFSTADDLTRFARMMIGGGALGSARVLAPLTVARMTSPATPVGESNLRGLGWDIDSSYSANRGEFLPLGSYGHTGFTGTSIWIDPATQLFVIFLSNRLHPDGKGDVTPLRARIATIAASSLVDVPAATAAAARFNRQAFDSQIPAVAPAASLPVMTGIDVLRADGFKALAGLRVGLLTNHTGRARDGASTIDLIAAAPGVKLVSLFSPEHGIRGVLDAAVPASTDDRTGLPIHSLYGATQRPTAQMLSGLDAIVIDLQDVGTRFYTYMASMAYVMEEAAKLRVKVVVLDRPNPIGGVQIEGPSLDAGAVGLTGYFPAMPIRHGLTLGELARLFNGENRIGADLTVVAMKNWRRDEWFDETGLPWVNPSPNMRNLHAATLYPGIGAFEAANISVGRGTDTPFEQIGAPWIDGVKLADALNARRIPGVRFYPVQFTPAASVHANVECRGVFIVITDRQAIRPVRVGVEIASAVSALFSGKLALNPTARLFGSAAGLSRIEAGEDPSVIARSWAAAESRWRLLRAKYLLY